MNEIKIELGHATIERRTNPPYSFSAWGGWQWRAKEFAVVPGASKHERGSGYELPADTPRATIERLSAPVYAEPAAVTFAPVAVDHAVDYALYSGRAYDADFEIVAHGDYIMVRADRITLSRVLHSGTISYHADAGESGVWQGKIEYSAHVGDWSHDPTPAALIDLRRKFGAVAAAFLNAHPEALRYALRLEGVARREQLSREIGELQSQIEARRRELLTLSDDNLPQPDTSPFATNKQE